MTVSDVDDVLDALIAWLARVAPAFPAVCALVIFFILVDFPLFHFILFHPFPQA